MPTRNSEEPESICKMVAHPDSTCPNCGRPLKRDAVCTFCKSKDPYVVNPIYYVWLVVSAAMVVSMVGYRIYKTGESIFISFKRMAGSAVYEVTLASADLPVSRNPAPSIQIERVAEIRQMLKDGREIELNAALDSYQKAFEGNHALDTAVCDAFYAFDTPQTAYEGLLSQWAERFPALYQPHLAMAVYYHAVGWDKRGARSAADTPKAAMAEMEYYLSMTEEKLTEALRINPNLVLGYSLLISIYNAMGKDAEENEAIGKACALFPDSFQIGAAAVWAKQPRWGGSYAAMEKLAKRMENAAVRLIDAVLAREKQWETIIGYWDRFLEYEPEHAEAYLERSGAHYHNGDRESAVSDLRTACDLGNHKACSLLSRFQ